MTQYSSNYASPLEDATALQWIPIYFNRFSVECGAYLLKESPAYCRATIQTQIHNYGQFNNWLVQLSPECMSLECGRMVEHPHTHGEDTQTGHGKAPGPLGIQCRTFFCTAPPCCPLFNFYYTSNWHDLRAFLKYCQTRKFKNRGISTSRWKKDRLQFTSILLVFLLLWVQM